MPHLSKRAISMYFKSGCKRQLRLNLANTAQERTPLSMPDRAVTRFGFEILTQQGEEWEADKVSDLVSCYGLSSVHGVQEPPFSPGGSPRWGVVLLDQALGVARPGLFIVQPSYDVCSGFEAALGIADYRTRFKLTYTDLRPDVIRVYPPGTFESQVSPLGAATPLQAGDQRMQLRVVDIKLTAEPSHRHYAEVSYYMMALAGWLQEKGLDSRFVVVDRGAVWPGSHDASAIIRLDARHQGLGTRPTVADLDAALDEDLEPVPLHVLAHRLITFFQRDLLEVLSVGPDWRSLPWHIDQRCAMCDFLGLDLPPNRPNHPHYCHNEARAADDLTRVAFLNRGSKLELHRQGVTTAADLAGHPGRSPVYDSHHSLRADRTIISSRAESLARQAPHIPAGRRTSALPSKADLRVYLTVDFDPGSGVTYAIGIRTLFFAPQAGSPRRQARRTEHAFIVPDRNKAAERRELLNALNVISGIFQAVARDLQNASAQIYVWDMVQAHQMKRLMERYLYDPQVQQQFRNLIWLFPPESVIANPELEKSSPVAVVKPVLRQLVGLPVEYDYTILDVARIFHGPSANPALFNVHPLFEAPLSDQIPFERAHEIWTKRGFRPGTSSFIPWNTLVTQMERTVKTRLRAMASIVERLERDLKGQDRLLLRATKVRPGRPRRARGVCDDGQLWIAYAELNSVSGHLEKASIHAMETHEREARFHSAILTERLEGRSRAAALDQVGVPDDPELWAYRLAPGSRDTKLRQGDFLVAISPLSAPGFLSLRLVDVVGGRTQVSVARDVAGPNRVYYPMSQLARVAIVEIDRDRELVVLRPRDFDLLGRLEDDGHCDFSADVILDPVHDDFWTKKLEHCLKAIGTPPLATTAPATAVALP